MAWGMQQREKRWWRIGVCKKGGSRVWVSCVWGICVWASCVWGSCVVISCVCEVCVRVCVCACVCMPVLDTKGAWISAGITAAFFYTTTNAISNDSGAASAGGAFAGRKDKGGGENDRAVKTVLYTYACAYLCIRRKHVFFLQNMMCSNGSICAMKSVPGREQFKTAGCHSCQLKAKSSWRLAVSESQTDNRHMNTVNCNNTSKEHDSTAVLDLPSDCCDHCCPLLWPLLRTECSETAASARWSRYLVEQHKTTGCHISKEKATSSWRQSVSESETDIAHMSRISSNSAIKDHGVPQCWTCQAATASAVM